MLDTPWRIADCGFVALNPQSAIRNPQSRSPLHPHALPEGDVSLDVPGRRLRVRVVPGRVPVHLLPDHHVVVARLALPVARRMRITLPEMFAADGLGWEVLVAFHHLGAIALGQDG